MRAYISGGISKDNDLVNFILTDLWFASPDYDGDLEESEECILVSGVAIDSICKNKVYHTRWKGIDVNGKEVFTIEELRRILKGKHIINGMAMFDEDVVFDNIIVGFEAYDGDWDVPYSETCRDMDFIA